MKTDIDLDGIVRSVMRRLIVWQIDGPLLIGIRFFIAVCHREDGWCGGHKIGSGLYGNGKGKNKCSLY